MVKHIKMGNNMIKVKADFLTSFYMNREHPLQLEVILPKKLIFKRL